MKKIIATVAAMFALTACTQKTQRTPADEIPTAITWIEDNAEPFVLPQSLYPDVPDSLWQTLDLEEDGSVPSSISCFLLEAEGKKILIDAGLGSSDSRLLSRLKELGVAPEELGLIYLTHLHRDHIGGLLTEGEVTFPTAKVCVNRLEAEAWLAMETEKAQLPKRVLEAYKDRLHLFEAGDTLEGGVRTLPAYGHTPGHTVYQKDSILVIGDLIHGAALQLEHPEYSPTYDMDADEARASRLRILQYAQAGGLTMYGMHLPPPARAKLTK